MNNKVYFLILSFALSGCLQQTITQGVTAFSSNSPNTSNSNNSSNTLSTPSNTISPTHETGTSSSQQKVYNASWFKVDIQAKENKQTVEQRFNSLCFLNFHMGWVVGSNGTIRHTKDAGATWAVQDTGESDLYSVHFIDSLRGWVAGDNGVIRKTIDGGETWELLDSKIDGPIYAIKFENQNKGIMYATPNFRSIDTRSAVYDTEDGGLTWIKRYESSYRDLHGLVLRNIHYISDSVALIDAGNEGILEYSFGSVKKNFSNVPATYHATTSQNQDIIWNYASNNKLFKSIDRGTNWIIQEQFTTDDKIVRRPYFWALAFANEKEGVLLESDNQYITTNGGKSWEKTNTPILEPNFGSSTRYLHNFTLFDSIEKGWAINSVGRILRLGTI
jgi:photosystem II stability/assembly factor-like uncharacterized protein